MYQQKVLRFQFSVFMSQNVSHIEASINLKSTLKDLYKKDIKANG
jgi:hypothetical protein